MIVITVRHFYQCESCGDDYIEQRKPDTQPGRTTCFSCSGNLIEVSTEKLTHEEPDPVVEVSAEEQ